MGTEKQLRSRVFAGFVQNRGDQDYDNLKSAYLGKSGGYPIKSTQLLGDMKIDEAQIGLDEIIILELKIHPHYKIRLLN